MSFQGIETFTTDTGQFTASSAGPGIPGGSGTLTFTGGIGRFSSAGGAKSDSRALLGADDATNATYVTLDLVAATFPSGGSISYFYTQPVFFKDSSNFMVPGVGPHIVGGGADDYSFQLILFKNGSRTNYSSQNLTIPGGHKVAIAIDGKFLDIWIYKNSTNLWSRIAHQDISAQFDMSVGGALTGYKPAVVYWTDASNSLSSDIDNLQWGPTTDFAPAFPYDAPTNLTPTFVGQTQVDFQWDASEPTFGGGELGPPPGYLVYRDGVEIAWVSTPGVTSYSDTPVLVAHTYSYRVAAADEYGDPISPQSAAMSVSTTGDVSEQGIIGFNDEQVYGGYFGGRLKGTTVACAGDNANKVKPCC